MRKAAKKEKKEQQNLTVTPKKDTSKEKKVEDVRKKEPAKDLESNWSHYVDIDETKNIQDCVNYDSLIQDSYEYSKYKKSDTIEQNDFKNDFFTLDLNRLDLMIRCEPFHTSFLQDLDPDDYLNEKVIERFETNSKLAIEQLNKLQEIENKKLDSENVIKKDEKAQKPIDMKPKEETKTVIQIPEIISTKPQAIEDWLDDLIIE